MESSKKESTDNTLLDIVRSLSFYWIVYRNTNANASIVYYVKTYASIAEVGGFHRKSIVVDGHQLTAENS